MKTKYGITKTFLYFMVILAFIFVSLVGYFWITNEYDHFKHEQIASILTAILLFILLAAKFISNRTQKSFDLFAEFFSKAATESAKIESGKLPFVEFESLARAANRMVQERNEAEAALRESEKNYRELVQSANSIILRMDTEGKVIFFNTYAQNFFGYREEEIIGKNVTGTIVSVFIRF